MTRTMRRTVMPQRRPGLPMPLRLLASVSGAVLAAGCTAEATSEYGVFYTVGPDAYDDDKALRDLEPCLDIDGADEAGQADSLPPQRSIDFAGSEENQRLLEECLAGLPGTRVTGLTLVEPTPNPS